MKVQRPALVLWLILGLLAALAACRGTGTPPAPPATAPPPTAVVAGPGSDRPPDVDNDAPAGQCENTANILSRVDRAPGALFRALALDNRVGGNDGDGIRGVRFAVSGDDLEYAKDETTAPYCIFGGNEPDCGTWPRDEAGRYTWGLGGPPVQPGRYRISVQVFGTQPDSATGSASCNWDFGIEVLPR